ncbi:hypothetical protein CDIK_2418 [Cucumispora dikerogammari]|nr:hypothetical protein CDIK_2418 [Cucumispora dikerogammari]
MFRVVIRLEYKVILFSLFLAGLLRFAVNILLYWYLFIMLSINTNFPTPFGDMHLYIIILFPQCFTVGIEFFIFKDSLGSLQTFILPSDENRLIFVSSLKIILFQSSFSNDDHFIAISFLRSIFFLLNSGNFLGTRLLKFVIAI